MTAEGLFAALVAVVAVSPAILLIEMLAAATALEAVEERRKGRWHG